MRTRAAKDRIKEEVLITEEDLRRLVRGCVAISKAWTRLANRHTDTAMPGAASYAFRTAALYEKMAARARKALAAAKGTWDEDEDEDVKCGIVPDEEWDQVREDVTEEHESDDHEPAV